MCRASSSSHCRAMTVGHTMRVARERTGHCSARRMAVAHDAQAKNGASARSAADGAAWPAARSAAVAHSLWFHRRQASHRTHVPVVPSPPPPSADSQVHWSRVEGATSGKVGPLLLLPGGRGSARIRAASSMVFPRPISSAKMPPGTSCMGGGGADASSPVAAQKYTVVRVGSVGSSSGSQSGSSTGRSPPACPKGRPACASRRRIHARARSWYGRRVRLTREGAAFAGASRDGFKASKRTAAWSAPPIASSPPMSTPRVAMMPRLSWQRAARIHRGSGGARREETPPGDQAKSRCTTGALSLPASPPFTCRAPAQAISDASVNNFHKLISLHSAGTATTVLARGRTSARTDSDTEKTVRPDVRVCRQARNSAS
mmetsp:Transcript_16874/g.52770  ORF Transcript_16874/g.52770 Transcript_16874/m.52770 type:complete len:374 (-) Transcript_16874:289-1410(-)